MTRYTVAWASGAEDDLADIWLRAGDPDAVTRAADAIDVQLAQNPGAQGIELREGLRALFIPPLRVIFAVSENDRRAEVLRVRLF